MGTVKTNHFIPQRKLQECEKIICRKVYSAHKTGNCTPTYILKRQYMLTKELADTCL